MINKQLLKLARELGATHAGVIPAANIVIEDELAGFCQPPGCNHYGLSASCPPHVGGPAEMRDLLHQFTKALIFKIDIPTEIVFSIDRRQVFALLHQVAAGVEQAACRHGCREARSFAGGSCKQIFCHAQPQCRVLAEGGSCRYPHSARPSLSGFGVNVQKLLQAAGWTMHGRNPAPDKDVSPLTSLCGMVLIS